MKNVIIILCLIGCRNIDNDKTNEFKPLSYGFLKFVVQDDPEDTIFLEANALRIIPKEGSESDILAVNKKGTYFLTLAIDRPSTAVLDLNQESHTTFISPNDTTEIEILLNDQRVRLAFSGKYGDINDYYQNKKQQLGYINILFPFNRQFNSSSKYNTLKIAIDSILNQEFRFLNTYSLSHQLPSWFYNYEMAEIKYAGAGFKTVLPSLNRLFKTFEDSLPDDYFDYLSNVKISDESAMNSTKYYMFLDSYFMRDLAYEHYSRLTGFARTQAINQHILSTSHELLSPSVKAIYYKYLLSDAIRHLNDSIKIDSLAATYGIVHYKDILHLNHTNTIGTSKVLNLVKGDLVPEFSALDQRDSLISIRNFSSGIVYLNFWATWCGPCIQNMKNLNALISEYSKKDDIYFINVCLDSEKDKWKMSIMKHQVKGINLFAAGGTNDQLKAYFNIYGIPHYVLLNKENVLIENKTDKAPYVKAKIDQLIQNR